MNHVFCAHRVRTLLIAFAMLMVSIQVSADGWIPTDAGLIVDLKYGDRIMLSVWYDANGNGEEDTGEEYFVQHYYGYTGGTFGYATGHSLKLIPQDTIISPNSVWTIDHPFTRTDWTMDGITYTMRSNNENTPSSKGTYALIADGGWMIKGSTSSSTTDNNLCDVVFAVPTVRAITNMDPDSTLKASHVAVGRNRGNPALDGQHSWAFDGKTGVGFLGLTYREVFMFASPKENKPRTYNNYALVGFNLTGRKIQVRNNDIAYGQALWAFKTNYDTVPRTVFRLYILDEGPTPPFKNSPNSYYFAYNRQKYRRYNNIDPTGGNIAKNKYGDLTSNPYTTWRKTYTTDYLFPMDSIIGNGKIWKTDFMNVPAYDSTYYYYVGERNRFHTGGGLGKNNAVSAFTKISDLPLKDRAGAKAPVNACGRMVVDTTSLADNLGVSFEPAGYFFRASSGRNVEMIQENDSTWRTEEAWQIDTSFMKLSGIVKMYSGPDFSLTDTGIVVPDWSKWQKARDIPLAGGSGTAEGKIGWAKIHTNRNDSNGHIEFVVAEQSKFVRYHNNGHFGEDIPDQYAGINAGDTVVTILDARLLEGYVFDGWAASANGPVVIYPKDSTSKSLRVGVEYKLPQLRSAGLIFTNDTVLHLYAKARYQGIINVAISFVKESDGKRYFLTQPGSVVPRYATARTFDDWTNVWQGMADINNDNPLYLSSYKIIGKDTECAECEPGEYVLDPRRETMLGAKDSLTFYENFRPSDEEYIGLYYPYPGTGYTNEGPYYVLSNNTWAGLFRSSNGWPTPANPCVEHTSLISSHYLTGIDSKITRVQRENSSHVILADSIVKYDPATNWFEGVSVSDGGTDFMLSGVGVVDAHYVILPDTTNAATPWTESITFGYHEEQQTWHQVWSKLIGKQLLAQMKVGDDTIYFHPNQNKILTDANDLRLANGFRLEHAFEYIRDARVEVQHVVATDNKPVFEQTSNAFCCNITSGVSSPTDVQDGGRYIDIVDTLRVWLRPSSASKIKEYYGRWKKRGEDDGLQVFADGSRYRDILVTTKTYHYGPDQTDVRLVPVRDSYHFGSLNNVSEDVNFRLEYITYHEFQDREGNLIRVETISIKDTTSILNLSSATFTLKSDTVFTKGTATAHGIRLTTKKENFTPSQNNDTLTVNLASITIADKTYENVKVSVPLIQVSTQGTELVWSLEHPEPGKRYFVMVDNNKSKFKIQDFTVNARVVRNGHELSYGAKSGDPGGSSDDRDYITPWKWTDVGTSGNQLTLKTEHGLNKYLRFSGSNVGDTAALADADSSIVTYIFDTVYTNANGNYEEIVRLKYVDKWVKFVGNNRLSLVADSAQASVFSWAYMVPEYHLLNNGTYPSTDEVVFGYNNNSSVAVTTAYKAYKEYSMLLNNKLVHLCRTDEANLANLTDADKDWKTTYNVELVRDGRDFDGATDSVSRITKSPVESTFVSTITPGGVSPTKVTLGGEKKYVNIVDTLRVTLGLQTGAPRYLFNDWSGVSSVSDACLKIPLVRMTYHEVSYDSIVCTVDNDEYNFAFKSNLAGAARSDSLHTFTLRTIRRQGKNIYDVDNNMISSHLTANTDVTVSGAMNLNSAAVAEVRLMDDYGGRPDWCEITEKTSNTITVRCKTSGVRTPRVAYMYFAYIVTVEGKTRFVNYRLSVSQASKFQYANNQHLEHSRGASGDTLVNGMQQVHENRRILYYYNPEPYDEPDQNVELPVRDRDFYGWWRWYREGEDERGNDVGDSDVPDSLWYTPPRNVGKFNFPFRIIGDSVKVPNPAYELDKSKPDSIKVLVTQGRYTVFHYPAKQYNDVNAGYNARKDPPAKSPLVYPPIDKKTLTYVLDLSNYYDNLPLSMKYINQADTAKLDTMRRIVEPTLSLREIFELHPWTEMAERLEAFKDDTTADAKSRNNNYLEDHVVRAPVGNSLLLSTEQRYNYDSIHAGGHSESLLGYYMRDENWNNWTYTGTEEEQAAQRSARQDTMIWCGGWPDDEVKMGWFTYNPKLDKYTPCNYTITGSDDFLKVPAVQSISGDFDTVYYCLRARSRRSTFDGSGNSTTEDGQCYFNICRYKIIYHNKSMYGPTLETTSNGVTKALITNDEIEQTYSVLTRLNFDYNKTGTDYQVYPHPLPWADASYGYSYPVSLGLPDNRYHNDFAPNFPGTGEYGLINKIPYNDHWHTMEQHGGAENGYMIYCDGMASAGQVAALSLDTTLCAGQQMYFSAYIGNPSRTNKAKPNFLFSVQGSTNGTDWDDITTYMTGELSASDKWYQILFPIEHNRDEGTEYKKFRVRIYNMSSNWDGNDFIIDDMCIFANRPPLVAYQANTTCLGKGETDSITHVVLRVDYQGFTNYSYNDTIVYYTVERISRDKTDTSFVQMIDTLIGWNKSDTIYGRIRLPKYDYVPGDEDSIFNNVADLIDRFDETLDTLLIKKKGKVFRVGYIYETMEDGSIRPVMYIVHKAKMTPDNRYTVRMSLSASDLLSTICAMTSRLKITNRMMLELNGEVQDRKEVGGLCANTTYEIGMRVKGSLYRDSIAPIELDGSCMNDWLLYGDTATVSSESRYRYKYSDIEKVLSDILRAELTEGKNANQFARNLGEVSRNEMMRVKGINKVSLSSDELDPYVMLTNLVNNGFLTLYQGKKTATVTQGDSVCYMVFPIVGTGSDNVLKMDVEVCPKPLYIKLKPTPGAVAAPLMIGGLNRDSTQAALPVVILADALTANSELAVRVDSIVNEKGIHSVELLFTDDPNYLEGIHTLELRTDKTWPVDMGSYYKKGDMILLSPAAGNNYEMQPGYSYTFEIVLSNMLDGLNDEGGCPVGSVPFTISVVPNYLRWNPKNTSANSWNNPDNWLGVTAQNRPIHADAHYVPLATTKVLIPALPDTMPYPVLPAAIGEHDSIRQVGFTYNTCGDIRFLPGAVIGQQQYLNYDNAIVDMSIPKRTWVLRAAPVQGMVSGDIFMSNSDLNAVSNSWEVGEFDANGRNYQLGNASFWLSVYSRATTHKGTDGSVTDQTTDASWSKVTNGLTLDLPAGQGWSVYTRTKTDDDAVVRLPKSDDKYYYFDGSGGKTDMFESVSRDANSGKLAFQPVGTSANYTINNATGVNSKMFVFGNPTMAYIDIWNFIADNSANLKGEISYMNASGKVYTPVSSASALGTMNVLSNEQRYLPPMHAMVVFTKDDVARNTLTLTLNANRVVTAPVVAAPSAPQRYTEGQLSKGIMTITSINNASKLCTSRVLLGQGYHDAILDGEDVTLTTINVDNYSSSTPTTPYVLYAAENGHGLSIDLRDSIVNVPLSYRMSNLTFEPVTYLWFSGVNSINGTLVLYDDLTGIEYPIIDGICLSIETPQASHERRYYIRRPGYVPEQIFDPITTGGQQPAVNTQDQQAQKILRNGQVYVLRNGHVYSIFGQKLR